MKKLIFGLIATLFCLTIHANPTFPKYDSILFNPNSCSCSGAFTTCAGSGNCSCSCGYFSCTCTASEKQAIAAIDISISADQYKNIEKLATKLVDLKMQKAVDFLSNSIENLLVKDADGFSANRKLFFNELSNMSSDKKVVLNNFFISINAEERV